MMFLFLLLGLKAHAAATTDVGCASGRVSVYWEALEDGTLYNGHFHVTVGSREISFSPSHVVTKPDGAGIAAWDDAGNSILIDAPEQTDVKGDEYKLRGKMRVNLRSLHLNTPTVCDVSHEA